MALDRTYVDAALKAAEFKFKEACGLADASSAARARTILFGPQKAKTPSPGTDNLSIAEHLKQCTNRVAIVNELAFAKTHFFVPPNAANGKSAVKLLSAFLDEFDTQLRNSDPAFAHMMRVFEARQAATGNLPQITQNLMRLIPQAETRQGNPDDFVRIIKWGRKCAPDVPQSRFYEIAQEAHDMIFGENGVVSSLCTCESAEQTQTALAEEKARLQRMLTSAAASIASGYINNVSGTLKLADPR